MWVRAGDDGTHYDGRSQWCSWHHAEVRAPEQHHELGLMAAGQVERPIKGQHLQVSPHMTAIQSQKLCFTSVTEPVPGRHLPLQPAVSYNRWPGMGPTGEERSIRCSDTAWLRAECRWRASRRRNLVVRQSGRFWKA